ncbi:DUF3618 domain-containing protein [Actinoplanes sp. NPDC024001]|uniref:DUF3618 domain-containing protein n=1 Tax=Actinoplanes sp. NPDC024001 TaxID=3154598 RepID=UPI0033D3F5E6
MPADTRPTKGAGSSAVAGGQSTGTTAGASAGSSSGSGSSSGPGSGSGSGQAARPDATPAQRPRIGEPGTYLTTPVHTETGMPKSAPHLNTEEAYAAREAAAKEREAAAREDEPKNGGGPKTADELKAEIERTRAEMGETAAALVAKVDVPGRVKQSAAETSTRLVASAADTAERAGAAIGEVPRRVSADPQRYAVIGAAVAAAAAGIVLIRRNRPGRR